ncbi:MAG: hypothetical protein NZ703_04345 [Gemmataceae bacterium]|nr:hypothetical protein [Gemmataceae bacterium]
MEPVTPRNEKHFVNMTESQVTSSEKIPPGEVMINPPLRDPLAAILSYLIPGLGQIYQGRIGKGLLFFFGLYVLFFYGFWMGQGKNVWLPYVRDLPDVVFFGHKVEGILKAVAYRPQYAAQFWIGIAAWPAIIQYYYYDPFKEVGPYLGKYQRAPTEAELNEIQRRSSKRWDLGWVFTVIAGILNLLVIYDAFAGPMIRETPEPLPTADPPLIGTNSGGPARSADPPGQDTPASNVAPPETGPQT